MFKKFLNEFKEFALKGSMIDMAVGLIMGSAFSGLITQLNDCLITPLLSLFTGGTQFDNLHFTVLGAVFPYGQFISGLINFFIQAFVLFLIIKGFHSMRREKPAPTTKACPYCQSEISIKAIRCPHCTSELEAPTK